VRLPIVGLTAAGQRQVSDALAECGVA
jgi:hypothetical protein